MLDKKEKEAEAREKKHKEDAIRADVMMVELIADLNISMNAVSTLMSAIKIIKVQISFSTMQNKHF